MIIIVVAPQGAGKTKHAEAIRKAYFAKRVVDEWDGVAPLTDGDLALTNVAPTEKPVGSHVISLKIAEAWARQKRLIG